MAAEGHPPIPSLTDISTKPACVQKESNQGLISLCLSGAACGWAALTYLLLMRVHYIFDLPSDYIGGWGKLFEGIPLTLCTMFVEAISFGLGIGALAYCIVVLVRHTVGAHIDVRKFISLSLALIALGANCVILHMFLQILYR